MLYSLRRNLHRKHVICWAYWYVLPGTTHILSRDTRDLSSVTEGSDDIPYTLFVRHELPQGSLRSSRLFISQKEPESTTNRVVTTDLVHSSDPTDELSEGTSGHHTHLVCGFTFTTTNV